jgi:hypothetical protein
MDKKQLKAKAKEIFGRHSKENTVYFTTDGQAFFGSHFADAHSQTLKDKHIVRITRDDVDDEEAEPVDEKAEALEAAQNKVSVLKSSYDTLSEAVDAKRSAAKEAADAAAAEGATKAVKDAAQAADKAYNDAVTKANDALKVLEAAEAELEKLQA